MVPSIQIALCLAAIAITANTFRLTSEAAISDDRQAVYDWCMKYEICEENQGQPVCKAVQFLIHSYWHVHVFTNLDIY